MTEENIRKKNRKAVSDAYDMVQELRKGGSATAADYIRLLITDFFELHGDRCFGDDAAVIGGIGYLSDLPVTVIGLEKGHDTKERIQRNFGSAHPEGYRKALRLMRQAEKFHRPVITFVDTAGASAGIDDEKRGQGSAIAECLLACAGLKTPILSVVIGEGGSGGALALALSDRLYMTDNAYFSVVSPESCAQILGKSPDALIRTPRDAADALCLTAEDIKKFGICDGIFHGIPAGTSDEASLRDMKDILLTSARELLRLTAEHLTEKRYQKYRGMTSFPLKG